MWSKLDDNFPDHAKVAAAGPLASWLYVCGLCYCNRLGSDGHIPARQVGKLADVENVRVLADKLVEVGLWEEVEGGYLVHDFLELNPSADEVKQRREQVASARSEAGKKGMASRWGDNKITNEVTTPLQTGLSPVDNKTITPTRPVKNQTLNSDRGKETDSLNSNIPNLSTSAPKGARDKDFDAFYSQFAEAYPFREGKRVGLDSSAKEAARRLDPDEWPDVLKATRNYKKHAGAFPVDPPRFFKSRDYPRGLWREWVNYEPPRAWPKQPQFSSNGHGAEQVPEPARREKHPCAAPGCEVPVFSRYCQEHGTIESRFEEPRVEAVSADTS